MNEINRRIEELEKAVATLRAYRAKGDFTKFRESEIIIAIVDYSEELEQLKAIRKANSSLFN